MRKANDSKKQLVASDKGSGPTNLPKTTAFQRTSGRRLKLMASNTYHINLPYFVYDCLSADFRCQSHTLFSLILSGLAFQDFACLFSFCARIVSLAPHFLHYNQQINKCDLSANKFFPRASMGYFN